MGKEAYLILLGMCIWMNIYSVPTLGQNVVLPMLSCATHVDDWFFDGRLSRRRSRMAPSDAWVRLELLNVLSMHAGSANKALTLSGWFVWSKGKDWAQEKETFSKLGEKKPVIESNVCTR